MCLLLILDIGGALEGVCSVALMYLALGIFRDMHYRVTAHLCRHQSETRIGGLLQHRAYVSYFKHL